VTTTDESLKAILSRAPVTTADDAAAILGAIVETLPAGDGVWCFSRLYQAVTDAIRGSLAATTFHDPRWLDRLDAAFANLYFEALRLFLDGSPDTPRAWYPLFASRSLPRAALQFALAGMNAHINRDLPVALVTVCTESGVELARTVPEYQDYLAVNPLLAAVEARIKVEFLTGPFVVEDRLLGKLNDVVANFSIVEARGGAWSHGEGLWALRNDARLSATLVDTLDGLVGFASRGLLVAL
jgi:hypothetical protein